jgi:hypothetical protein
VLHGIVFFRFLLFNIGVAKLLERSSPVGFGGACVDCLNRAGVFAGGFEGPLSSVRLVAFPLIFGMVLFVPKRENMGFRN